METELFWDFDNKMQTIQMLKRKILITVGKKLIESQFKIGTIFYSWWKMKDSPYKGMKLVKKIVRFTMKKKMHEMPKLKMVPQVFVRADCLKSTGHW